MTLYDFTAETLDGRPVPLADYQGKVVLIVNTASKCGFTPQFEGLEALNRKFADRGLVILGFPCNQFGAQEPVEVNGPKAHPVYAWLKAEKPGLLGSRAIKWNFTKFLADRSGRVVDRFAPNAEPASLQAAIEALL